ncbi:MAG TPA: fibronectin type III domain-containing protein [Trebonia sp.]|nr:fibronectin type III domain-containing protein [Trebonia sp.]
MDELRDGDPRQTGTGGTGQSFPGPSLATAVATYGPLPLPSVLTLAAGLAEALSAAHAAGVVHGDLKPANVVLAPDGPRLIDSGISRAADLEAGRASDIYGLGAVLLYAATGTWMAHFGAHLDQLPGELRALVERCMAVDPVRRPTAAGFRTELIAAYPAADKHIWPVQAPPPAPFGAVAAAMPPRQAPSPAETITFDAQKGTPKRLARPAFIGRFLAAWKTRRRGRHAWLMAIVALAFAVAGAGTVYIIHPWPYPVLRPTGLTADGRGPNSISLGWSNPGSGPLPDKYVIIRNGAVAATVAGNVNHFKDSGLAPETKYDFRVIAYRGSAHSQASLNVYVTTQTPPLSEAVFNSFFLVNEKIEAGASSVQGDSQGDVWVDQWTFTSGCALGPCTTQLSGQIDGQSFTSQLKPVGGGSYTGSAQINDYYYCGSSTTNTEGSTLYITVNAAAAHTVGNRWEASKLSGGITWSIDTNPNGGCGGGQLVLGVSG